MLTTPSDLKTLLKKEKVPSAKNTHQHRKNTHDVDIIERKGAVRFVLIVEKLSVFNLLVQLRFHVTHNCVIMTGSGVPDLASRGAVFKLAQCLPVNMYGLVDLNLYALRLFYMYKYGSKSRAFENLNLACRDLIWLGARPADAHRARGDPNALSADDRLHIEQLMHSLPQARDTNDMRQVLDMDVELDLHAVFSDETVVEYVIKRIAAIEMA